MVDGAWRLWAKEVLSFDEAELLGRVREATQILWGRMRPSA